MQNCVYFLIAFSFFIIGMCVEKCRNIKKMKELIQIVEEINTQFNLILKGEDHKWKS